MKKYLSICAAVLFASGAAQAGGISVPGFGPGAVGSGPAEKEVIASCFVSGGRISEGETYKLNDVTYVCTARYDFRAGKAVKSSSGAMVKVEG